MLKATNICRETFAEMLAQGRILEQDERGAKVILLDNGDILKVFRVRHRWSFAHFFSYARRFCLNATRLQKRLVPTVNVKSLYRVQGGSESLVCYAPLPGKTLRQLLDAGVQWDASRLGAFIASLHHKGVHFRSLHFGNIVMCDNKTFGLIDIADMRVYPWPLFCNTRARNFKHFCRYEHEIRAIGRDAWHELLLAYSKHANMSAPCREKLNSASAKLAQQIF